MDYVIKHCTLQYRKIWITAFDKILKQYTEDYEVVQIKTTNMGSLFKLTYNLTLKKPETEKELIDKLRCRNGNLEITMCRQETVIGEL